MSRTSLFLLLIACIAFPKLGAIATANAKTYKANAGTNEETHVRKHWFFYKNCKTTIPRILITKKPKHGTLDIRPTKGKLRPSYEGYRYYKGRNLPAAGVYYRSNKGFTGYDDFKYRVLLPDGRRLRFKAKIAVGR